ncbi:hypothetical protein ACJ72_05168 [Emergomyces africanus]|uniref:Uncharacterized protein n=1 Tax=Emergomyces africanus TaxID=1955775 RepID=A0A1B7NUT6_9EURO|nr:hypothetical protein ACJ72_05168 [Emergomyces africanus]
MAAQIIRDINHRILLKNDERDPQFLSIAKKREAQCVDNTRPQVWRSSLILAFTACYLMWAITFLAQLHPLIAPKRSDMRPDRVPH